MKRLLIASAAFALIGASSAMAQATTPASPAPSSDTSMQSAPATTTPAPGATTPSATPSAAATPDPAATAAASTPATSTAAAPTASSTMAMAGSTAPGQIVGDMSQQNPPPAKYPPCTSRKEDRCVVTAQLKHHMTMAKRKTAATTHTGA